MADTGVDMSAARSAALEPRAGLVRNDWTRPDVAALFALPFTDLMFQAQRVHREHFDPREVQISTLLSIKTGGCPEDCGYCPQSVHYDTGVTAAKLMEVDAVLAEAQRRQGGGRDALLHGRGLALRPRTATSTRSCAMVDGREGARPGDLRDARHADRATRRAA